MKRHETAVLRFAIDPDTSFTNNVAYYVDVITRVVCGEALRNLFAIESDEGLSFDARIGGSPLNVAVGLSRLRQESALFTGLLTDRLGARIHDVLAREGVDTGLLIRMPNPTTLSLVDVGEDGSPAYAFCG